MKEFKLDYKPKITTGFTTPEGYFDAFSEKMMAQLPNEESPKVISIYSTRKRWIFAAAAVLVLALSVPIFNKLTTNTAELDQQTLEDYIAYNSNISENDLVNLLEKEDIEKMNMDYNIQDKDVEDLFSENNDIEQYITN